MSSPCGLPAGAGPPAAPSRASLPALSPPAWMAGLPAGTPAAGGTSLTLHGIRAPGAGNFSPRQGWRIRTALVLAPLLLAYVLLGLRLAQIHILQKERWSRAAERQQVSLERRQAPRGALLAGGQTLAHSVPSAAVLADLKVLKTQEERRAAAEKLAPLLERPGEELAAKLERDERRVEYLARDLNPEVARKIQELKIRGLALEPGFSRQYPQGPLACHLLGCMGSDGGQEGLELKFDALLRGIPGYRFSERDAARRPISRGDELTCAPRMREPQAGLSVSLALHPGIQFVAEEELERLMREYKPVGATALVLDVRSGAVLAMACRPGYDPNHPAQAGLLERRIRSVCDVYEPGSTFKTFIAARALERGTATRVQLFDCENGAWRLGYRTLHDAHAYGLLSFDEVIVHSSNIGAAKIGLGQGLDGVYAAVVAFGFGTRTGLDLPGEARGLLHPRAAWTRDSLYSIPMGQEIAVTPIQLVTAYAAMVNGGVLLRPQLVASISNARGETLFAMRPQPVRRVLSTRTSLAMREILLRAVEEGTGRKAWCREYAIGGKTGTAQKAKPGGYDHEKFVASFCGFAPAENPRLVCLVTADEPQKSLGYYGGSVAAPAAREILRRGLNALGVPSRSPEQQAQAALAFERRHGGGGD